MVSHIVIAPHPWVKGGYMLNDPTAPASGYVPLFASKKRAEETADAHKQNGGTKHD